MVHQSWHFRTGAGLGAIRAELLQRTCFNIFHQLYSFGIGKYGQRFTWPNNASLKAWFAYYDASLWYYARSTLETDESKNTFIANWH